MGRARDEPEQLLSAALRAHAGGAAAPRDPPSGQAEPDEPHRLPVLRVLLFALVLGLVAGAAAGTISVL